MTFANHRSLLAVAALVAMLFTGLNAVKPMHIDDYAYYLYAQHIKDHPLDPYGFDLNWKGEKISAMSIVAPPVFPYLLAGLQVVFGENPHLWKLGMFPVNFLLVLGLLVLGRRFAPGWEVLVTVSICLSPLVLPGANLMLEVPVLCFGIWALWLMLKALESEDFKWAVLAGILAGLTVETKYSGLILGPIFFLWNLAYGRVRQGIIACLCGLITVSGAEALMVVGSGSSHLLTSLGHGAGVRPIGALWASLFAHLGAGGVGLYLMALAGCGLRIRLEKGLSYGWIGTVLGFLMFFGSLDWELVPWLGNKVIATLWDAAAYLILGRLLWLFWRGIRSDLNRRLGTPSMLLGIWFLCELIFYFLVSPFPAMRRVIYLAIPAALILARDLSERNVLSTVPKPAMGLLVCLSGFWYLAADIDYARARQEAVSRPAKMIAEIGGKNIWYSCDWLWGLNYEAARLGLRYAKLEEIGTIPRGGFLIHNSFGIHSTGLQLPPSAWQLVMEESWIPSFKVFTHGYYSGRRPLNFVDRPMGWVKVYRRL